MGFQAEGLRKAKEALDKKAKMRLDEVDRIKRSAPGAQPPRAAGPRRREPLGSAALSGGGRAAGCSRPWRRRSRCR